MKELDVLLERFVRTRYGSTSAEQKQAFAQLLELPDPELVDYFFGYAIPKEPQLADLARVIATHQP